MLSPTAGRRSLEELVQQLSFTPVADLPLDAQSLPPELIAAVAQVAKDVGVLTTMPQVCRSWRDGIAASFSGLWRDLALERFPRLRALLSLAGPDVPCYRSVYANQLAADSGLPACPALELRDYALTLELSHQVVDRNGKPALRSLIARGSGRLDSILRVVPAQSQRSPWFGLPNPDTLLEVAGGSITLVKEPLYDVLVNLWDSSALAESLRLKFLLTRLPDMKTFEVCNYDDCGTVEAIVPPHTFIPHFRFGEEYDGGWLTRIPDMFDFGELWNRHYEPWFTAHFFPSTLLIDFDLLLWHEVDDVRGDVRPVKLDEFKKYLKWYAPWDGVRDAR